MCVRFEMSSLCFPKLFNPLVPRKSQKDPDTNPRLRSAMQAARSANMPKENIQRAISMNDEVYLRKILENEV